jgi:hypothetical protein
MGKMTKKRSSAKMGSSGMKKGRAVAKMAKAAPKKYAAKKTSDSKSGFWVAPRSKADADAQIRAIIKDSKGAFNALAKL